MPSRKRDRDVDVEKSDGEPMTGTELTPVKTEGARAKPGHLERSWVRHRLIREFALGEKSGLQLSKEYGVSPNSISLFKKKHLMEIEEVRNNLADEYAGVWIAQKLERIRQYQDAAERMADGRTPRNAEVLVTILKAVAEELGQLPARTQVNVQNNQIEYQIVGVDPDDI